jgi:hypothetical protein
MISSSNVKQASSLLQADRARFSELTGRICRLLNRPPRSPEVGIHIPEMGRPLGNTFQTEG